MAAVKCRFGSKATEAEEQKPASCAALIRASPQEVGRPRVRMGKEHQANSNDISACGVGRIGEQPVWTSIGSAF